jgi:hypothetical protein
MNATLGTELPTVNFTNQTTVPLGYTAPATEIISDGETQIWKLTHNGVDTHLIHFHLFNVQVLNRMGWDGSTRPPDANELGWKDTVRMNPLEDITFAMKAVSQSLPFSIPNSNRLLDVTLDQTATFPSLDPLTGGAVTVPNVMTNFGWEYVWHCHILGHEENDMMRPIIFQVASAAPPTPVLDIPVASIQMVSLGWTEPATNATNGVVGFYVQRATETAPGSGIAGAFATIATLNGSTTTTYADTAVASATPYWYQIIAFNGAGQSAPSNVQSLATLIWVGTATVTLTPNPLSPQHQGIAVLFSAAGSGASPGVTYQYRFWLNSGAGNVLVQDYSANPLWALPATTVSGSYTVTVDVRTDFTSLTPAASVSNVYVITAAPLVVSFKVNNPLGGTLQGTTTQTLVLGGTATLVTALANPGYVFVNWTATPTGFVSTTAGLNVTNITTAQQYVANFASVTATPFRIGTFYFASLQDAYNAAAVTGDTIQVYAGTQTGTLLANRPVDVKISGGWNVGYTTNLGMTTIYEIATLKQGKISVQNVKIIALNRPVITTVSPLTSYTIGSGAYTTTFTASAGVAPYSFTVTAGALPAGMSLAPSGLLSGTPTTTIPGAYNFTVTVTDSAVVPLNSSKTFTMDIVQPFAITTTTLPNATHLSPYSQTIVATGSAIPYSYAVTVGTLPAGLSLNPATGVISGTPTTAGGPTSFTVTVTGSTTPPATVSKVLSLTVI